MVTSGLDKWLWGQRFAERLFHGAQGPRGGAAFHTSPEVRIAKQFRSEITKIVRDAKQLTVAASALNGSISSFLNNNGG